MIKQFYFKQVNLTQVISLPLALYLFIMYLDYVLRKSINKIQENGFKLIKERSRKYPAKTIIDTDYTDDIALLANTPAQVETLRHSLK